MKKSLQKILITLLIVFTSFLLKTEAQNLYTLDLADPANFSTDCGTVTPSKWSVKNDFCSLTTTGVNFPGDPFTDPAMVATVTVVIKSTGNVTCKEVYPPGAFIRSSVNNQAWNTDVFIKSCSLSGGSSYTFTYQLNAPAGASVRLMVSLVDNTNTEKLWIQDGEITIGSPVVADSITWTKREINPELNSSWTFNEASTTDFKVFPNPNDGSKIQLSLTGSEENEVLLTLYDPLGRQIYSKAVITNNGNFLETISNGNRLAPGIYLITGTSENEIYKQTLIVK